MDNVFGACTVELPSLVVQRRIASILSAYDELMANSRRRIRRGVQKPLSGAWMTWNADHTRP